MGIKIVIINGMARCGKDTFMEMCSKIVPIRAYSTIDYFKKVAKEQFKWDEEKNEKGRKLLSDLKIAAINYNNLPVNMFCEYYDNLIANNSDVKILFCVCRDIVDIEQIKNTYSNITKTLLIENNRVPHISTNEGDNNVYNFEYDYIVENNGTLEELEEAAKSFVEEILK